MTIVRNALGRVRTVVVLGGASDIGQAIARALAEAGAERVVLAARRPAELPSTGFGSAAVHPVAFDADDTDSHAGLFAALAADHGDLDVVVVAFGVLGDQDADERDPARAVAVARTNFVGAVSALTAASEHLKTQGHGQLVVLSSVAGERVRRSNYVYGATKAGLDGFALGLADALAGTGVGVLVVRPGFVVSKMTDGMAPAPLSTTPDAVAAAVVRGLRRGSTLIWVPAPLRLLMSVLRHVPRPLFRRLPL